MFSDRQILADFEAEIRSGGRKREKERVLRGCALTRVDGCRVNPREASSQGADDNRLILENSSVETVREQGKRVEISSAVRIRGSTSV